MTESPYELIERLADALNQSGRDDHLSLAREALTFLATCRDPAAQPSEKELDELEDTYYWLDANHSKPWREFALSVLELFGKTDSKVQGENFRQLCAEQLKWLVEFQATSKLNDVADDLLSNLMDRCYDALRYPEPDLRDEEDVIHLLRFMCETWAKIDDWFYSDVVICEGSKDVVDSYPVIQGSANNMALKRIAAQPYDKRRVQSILSKLGNEGGTSV